MLKIKVIWNNKLLSFHLLPTAALKIRVELQVLIIVISCNSGRNLWVTSNSIPWYSKCVDICACKHHAGNPELAVLKLWKQENTNYHPGPVFCVLALSRNPWSKQELHVPLSKHLSEQIWYEINSQFAADLQSQPGFVTWTNISLTSVGPYPNLNMRPCALDLKLKL